MTLVAPRTGSLLPALLLVGTAAAIAIGYLVLGTGPVLDDWFGLRNAHFDGALRAAGSDQIHARPVAALVYAFVFGVLGRSTVATVLLMALVNAGSALLLARLLRRVCEPAVALAAAWLWLVLPTTTSIEAWASASNISLGLAAALGSIALVDHPPTARWGTGPVALAACGLVAAVAVLSYEAMLVLVVGGVAAVSIKVADRSARRRAAAALVGAVGAFAWTVINWHPRKDVTSIWGDVTQVLSANLGPGVASGLAWIVIGFPVLVVSGFALLPSWRPQVRSVLGLIVVGWATLVVGTLPFVKYTYAPVGAGDRVNVISSLGGAALVAATCWVVARRRPLALMATCVAVALVSLPTRVTEMRPWGQSARDGATIIDAVAATRGSPGPVVVGPELVDHGGVTAMQLPYITEAAVQLALDEPEARGTLTTSVSEFEAADGTRIDLRQVLEEP